MAKTKVEEHARFTRLLGGYAAFIASLIVLVMARGSDLTYGWVALSLFAFSLPLLIATMLIDYLVRLKQAREVSTNRAAVLAQDARSAGEVVAVDLLVQEARRGAECGKAFNGGRQ